jgi:hypothetical protein
MPLIVVIAYALMMTAAALAFARMWKSSFWMTIFTLHCMALIMSGLITGTYAFVVMKLPDGVKTVILAGVSFLAALTVSGLKAGLGGWLKQWLRSFHSAAQD